MKCKIKIKFQNKYSSIISSSICTLPLPIVVIHSEDDAIIPYFHFQLVCSSKLFCPLKSSFQIDDYVKQHRDKNLPTVRFITVPRSAGCGHNHIYSYPKFQEIVR